MTVADITAVGQSEAVTMEFDLPHSPRKVWRALTDPSLLSQWLLPVSGFRAERGADFRFQAPPQPGWDGAVDCRLREIESERALSWSWVAAGIDTVVTFTLTPTPTGTRLSVVQSGFREDQKKNFGGARYGWRMMGARLVDLLAADAA